MKKPLNPITSYCDRQKTHKKTIFTQKQTKRDTSPSLQLFGQYVSGKWKPGLMAHILSNVHAQAEASKMMVDSFVDRKKPTMDPPSIISKWIIVDGMISSIWVDAMSTLYGDTHRLTLANNESISLDSEFLFANPWVP